MLRQLIAEVRRQLVQHQQHDSFRCIQLICSYDDDTPLTLVEERLAKLRQSLLAMDVVLEVELNPNLHDHKIPVDNGYVIKIGRGLDFYQNSNQPHH